MGTALVILLLLTLCGFIAYIGDLLGRRLGKKRLSVFGLRPKHTAILLTVVTGVVIAGVTFGAALISLPWFRDVVTQGEQLAHQNQRLSEQGIQLTRKNQDLERQTRDQLRRNEELAGQNQQLTGQNQQLGQQNRQLQGTNQTLRGENERLTTSNRQLAGSNVTLRKQNAGFQTANRALQSRNQELRRTSQRLAQENTRLDVKARKLLSTNSRLVGEQVQLREDLKRLGFARTQFAEGNYLFRKGEQICDRRIPANPDLALLRSQLKDLLTEGEHQARRRSGREKGPGTPLDVIATDDMPQGVISTAAILEWTAQKAFRIRNKPVALRLVADENVVEGQKAPVRLETYANDFVFSKGEELDSREMDGSLAEEFVFEGLLEFVQGVGAKARRYMVTSSEGVGESNWPFMFDALRRIKKVNGPVRVIARARQDTFRSGPLSIDLEVIPAASKPLASR